MNKLATVRGGKWKIVPLGSIADVRLGKMLDKTKHTSGRRMPYLRNINVRWGTIDTDDLLEMYFKDDELERYGLKPGDVLVCEGGEPGRAAVWNGQLPELKYQKALHRIRFREPYEPSLFVYLLELLAKTGAIASRFTGSTIKHFTREALVELPIPVPPANEQREIVAEIEKQFTRLEAGVAVLRRVQANLKRYRAAVLKAACEGKLVPTEAELARQEGRTHETGTQLLERILAERRKKWDRKGKYKEPVKPDTANLPPLPEDWVWASGAQLFSWSSGDGLTQKEIRPGRYPVYGGNGITGYHHACLITFPTLVIGRVGALCGNVYLTKESAWITDNAIYATECPSSVSMEFLRWGFVNAKLNKLAGGSGQPFVNQRMLNETNIPLPPHAEQQRIVAELERRLSVIEELEAAVNVNLQRAIRLRQSILQRAFEGRL